MSTEHLWNDNDKGNREVLRKNVSKSNATTINLLWAGLGLNPDLFGESPENNHPSPIVVDRG
jgi:hypothetical protein